MDKEFTVRVVYDNSTAEDLPGVFTPDNFDDAYSRASVKASKLGVKLVGIFFRVRTNKVS